MSNKLISDDDLKDFDLEKYADLKRFSYKQWRGLILHRSMLWDMASTWRDKFKPGKDPFARYLESARQRATEHGLDDAWTAAELRFRAAMQADVTATVTALLRSPLDEAFTLPSYLESGNPLATASIRLRPQPYTGTAAQEPDKFNADLFGAVDGVPLAQAFESTDEPRRILLEVDIDTPNAQLVADFHRWLMLWRYATVADDQGIPKTQFPAWVKTTIKRWLEDNLVAYLDLKLVSKFLIRDFPDGRLAKELGIGVHKWSNAEKRLERYKDDFFSAETSDLMFFLSFDEERCGGTKKAP